MKNVLFVSYTFPPLLAPGSFHCLRAVRHLPKYGWNPIVVTVDEKYSSFPKDFDLLNTLPKDLKIFSTKTVEYRLLLKIINRTLPWLLAVPDQQIGWYPFAMAQSKRLLKEFKIDLIYTRANPFTCHMVGLALKKQTNLPWVTHFSDPWTDSQYFKKYNKLQHNINKSLEQQTVALADAIVFTNEQAKDLVMHKYPQYQHKGFVIPQGFDRELVEEVKKSDLLKQLTAVKKSFRMVYTGNFYGERNPVNLMSAVSKIKSSHPDLVANLEILLVGEVENKHIQTIAESGLNNSIKIVKTVPYRESIAYMLSADLLLLIDAPNDKPSPFLPSKLIEYVSTNKPILGLTPVTGAAAELLKQTNNSVVAPEDKSGIEKQLINILSSTTKIAEQDYSKLSSKYDSIYTTQQLSEIFDSVVKKA